MAGEAGIVRARSGWRRAARWAVASAAVAAVVPLTFWAVPGAHPGARVRATWADNGGDQVTQWVVRRGFDRNGYVHQEQLRTWNAATPAALEGVRASHPVELPPTRSWLLQYTEYGHDHVYLPRGLLLTEDGVIRTLPYSLMALALSSPAMLWGVVTAWRRVRGWASA